MKAFSLPREPDKQRREEGESRIGREGPGPWCHWAVVTWNLAWRYGAVCPGDDSCIGQLRQVKGSTLLKHCVGLSKDSMYSSSLKTEKKKDPEGASRWSLLAY